MGWLSNYSYRKKIPVNTRAEGTLTNYQMLLTIYSGNGSDSAGTVYLENHTTNWPNDIRFTQSDGSTEIDYFIESSSSHPIKCWVEIPSISDSVDTDYYIYYNSNGASSDSDGSATFDFFDDYSSDTSSYYEKHTTEWNGVDDSWHRADYNSDKKRIRWKHSFDKLDMAQYGCTQYFGTAVQTDNGDTAYSDITFFYVHADTSLGGGIFYHSGSINFQTRASDTYTSAGMKKYCLHSSNSYIFEIKSYSPDWISGQVINISNYSVIYNSGSSTNIPTNLIDKVILASYYENEEAPESTLSYDATDNQLNIRHKRGCEEVNCNAYIYTALDWWFEGKYSYPEPTWETPSSEEEQEGNYVEEGETLKIYYSCNSYPSYYIDCWCTRWDESNYDITIETFLTSGTRNTLFNHLVPGAVRESYNILGTPMFIDSTYSSSNTLIVSPINGYGLSSLRETRTIAVKSISDTFLNKDTFGIKLEGKILSSL